MIRNRWKAVRVDGLFDFVVGCPRCGREYNAPTADYFRFCPECGKQLSDRKICTFGDKVLAEERRQNILNGGK